MRVVRSISRFLPPSIACDGPVEPLALPRPLCVDSTENLEGEVLVSFGAIQPALLFVYLAHCQPTAGEARLVPILGGHARSRNRQTGKDPLGNLAPFGFAPFDFALFAQGVDAASSRTAMS